MNQRFKPSKKFFRYAADEYCRKNYGHSGFKIEDYIREKLLTASYGLTAWIRSKPGANWAFQIVGVEETIPHDGYNYFFCPPQGDRRRINDTKKMRVFRKIPVSSPDLSLEAIDISKRVIFTEGWRLPSDDIIRLIFSYYRSWLKTGDGLEWLSCVFDPIKYVLAFNNTAYKYVNDKGQVYWFDDKTIISDAKLLETCICCEMSLPCTDNYSGLGTLCVRCYAENFADTEVLKQCNRDECKFYGCSNFLSHDKFDEISASVSNLPVKYTGTLNG